MSSNDDGCNIFHDLLPAEAVSEIPRQPAAQHPAGGHPAGGVPEQADSFHMQPAAQHSSQGPGEDSLHMYGGQPNSNNYGSHPGMASTPATQTPVTLEPGAETQGSQSNKAQLMQVKHAR